MLINSIALTGLDICAKTLTQSLTPPQIVLFYKFLLFLITLPWVLVKGLELLKTSEIKIHFLRSLLSVLGGICFYKGLQNVKIADAAALENLQYIIVAIVGMIFFEEKCTKTKVFSIILGFLGALFIVKPEVFLLNRESFTTFNNYYIYTLLAIIFWSMNTITVKILGKTERNRTQLFYLLLFAIMWSLPGALLRFDSFDIFGFELSIIPIGLIDFSTIQLNFDQLKLLFIMAFFYFVHSLAYFNALKRDISLVIPFRYSKLIFSGIAGYLFFMETPISLEYVGYTLIIISGLTLITREVRQMKKNRLLTKPK
jgi:S-adenosylmethionine uptake transporter